MAIDSDDEMAGPDPYRSDVVLGEGNEAYRVFDEADATPAADGNGYHSAGQ